jgi:uncharacterized membrane protein YcaP (DUF421 family)
MIIAAGNLENFGSLLETIFGGDYPPEQLAVHQVAARAIVVYLVGVAAVRVGKSRIMSRTTTLDVLLGFILGSLLSRGITGHASISGTAISSLVIIACHWVLTAIACRSHWFGDLIKGHSRLVVKDGSMLHQQMLGSHISDHDLFEQMRLKGIDDVHKVREAYKERNGEISFLETRSDPRIVDIAVKDGVQTVRIALS